MKQTYTNKYYNWALIVISILFLISTSIDLFLAFDFLSTYLLRIVFGLVSIAAIISLITTKANGERYSRFFIIVSLIFPNLYIINEFLIDWSIYGIIRLRLLENPFLHLQFILGIILFIFSIKYSRQTALNRKKDYELLISCVGVFLILLILIRTIEPYFIDILNKIPIWKTITKVIIGLFIIYCGNRLKNEKMEFTKCVILTLISMFIYGLI